MSTEDAVDSMQHAADALMPIPHWSGPRWKPTSLMTKFLLLFKKGYWFEDSGYGYYAKFLGGNMYILKEKIPAKYVKGKE